VSHTEVQWARGTTTQVAGYTGPAGELVVNIDDWSLQAQDGVTAGGWVIRPRFNVRTVTGTGSQPVNLTDDLIAWNPATPAAVTFTLPASPRLGETHSFKYLLTSTPYYAMTIAAPAGQTIDGQSSIVLATPYGRASFTYVGSNAWAASSALQLLQPSVLMAGELIGANFNTTADQAIALISPTQYWLLNSLQVTNPSVAMTTAAGGIYSGAGKTGVQLLAASTSYSGLTSNSPNTSGNGLTPTLGNGGNTTLYNLSTVYLSLSTPQGAPATADIRIYIRPLW
jgi:hypothetical protein